MKNRWAVEYGCYDWQDVQYFPTEQEAIDWLYSRTIDDLTLGSHTADFAFIRDENDDIIEERYDL